MQINLDLDGKMLLKIIIYLFIFICINFVTSLYELYYYIIYNLYMQLSTKTYRNIVDSPFVKKEW